jgi:hypothetical protein
MNRNQVITIHHSKEREESIGKGAKTEFDLPKQGLSQDGISNEEG